MLRLTYWKKIKSKNLPFLTVTVVPETTISEEETACFAEVARIIAEETDCEYVLLNVERKLLTQRRSEI